MTEYKLSKCSSVLATDNYDDEDVGDGFQDMMEFFSTSSLNSTANYNFSTLDKATYYKSLPNYSNEPEDMKYKYGYIELSEEDNGDCFQEAYRRIYNALKYGPKYNHYVFYRYDSTGLTQNYGLVQAKYSTETNQLYIYLGELSLTSAEVSRIFSLVRKDNPEVVSKFGITYTDSSTNEEYISAYQISTNTSTGFVYAIAPYYYADTADKETRINKTFKKICNTVKKAYNIEYKNNSYATNNKLYTADEKSKIAKVIHDYLCTHNDYGDTSSEAAANGTQIAWSALSEGEFNPVCAGYAAAFCYCCWKFGITCLIEVGTADSGGGSGNHAWNFVTYEPLTFLDEGIDNAAIWQELDCTWDDPSSIEYSTGLNFLCCWDYFDKKTEDITDHHRNYYVAGSSTNGVYKTFPVENGTCETYIYDKLNNNNTNGGQLYLGM